MGTSDYILLCYSCVELSAVDFHAGGTQNCVFFRHYYFYISSLVTLANLRKCRCFRKLV